MEKKKEEIKEELYTRCKYCGRRLKTLDARKRGYGLRCYEKHNRIKLKYESLIGEDS